MAEPMVKGAAIRDFFSWYEQKSGLDRMRELATHIPADLQSLVDPADPLARLLPSSWYPCRLVHGMLDALAENTPEIALKELVRDANRYVVRRNMGGVYHFLLERLVTPEMYALAVPRMWRQLHTTGTRKITILGAGEAESIVSDWPGHHPVLCTCTLETMRAIFEVMGKKHVTYERLSCVSDGAKQCVTRLKWR